MQKAIVKRLFIMIPAGILWSNSFSQLNISTDLYVSPGTELIANGLVQVNAGATLRNNGQFTIYGSLYNNGTINELTAGTFTFKNEGRGGIGISGTQPIGFHDVIFKN